MKLRLLQALLVFSLVAGTSAKAAVVMEQETGGEAVNNSLASAQAIPNASFTSPVPAMADFGGARGATVQGMGGFGAFDVDFYSFIGWAGLGLYVDVDDAGFDSMIFLFDSSGTLLAYADDSSVDDGSASSIDPFLGWYTLSTNGTYHIAVTENPNFAKTALTGVETLIARPAGGPGGYAVSGVVSDATFYQNGAQPVVGSYAYNMHVVLTPEPSSISLIGLGVLFAIPLVYRRRR